MKKEAKIILTDIDADRNRTERLTDYQTVLASAFMRYATIKLSMNLFTMYEMSEEISLDRRDEIEGYIDMIDSAIRSTYSNDIDKSDNASLIESISDIRDTITARMKVLTAYTDALQLYEYILNRREPDILGLTDETIDTDQLAESMYSFAFSENDKMLVNTRIQEFIAQLPVRMTKERFFDIISNSLAIYRGGEVKSVDDFVQTIKDSSLISKPEGFDSYYPKLFEIYNEFKSADYKGLDRAGYESLSDKLTEGTEMIQSAVTDYLMLTEIINDVLLVLYVSDTASKEYLDEKYEVAAKILVEIVSADDIYEASESFDKFFASLEGAQEDAFEELTFIEARLDDISTAYYDSVSEEGKKRFDSLRKADTLTSSSLFMDIDQSEISVVSEEADDIYINETKEELIDCFTELFKDMKKYEKRSVMAKVLSLMPVFFNSQQEILEYFKYALSSCSDKAELTAVRDLVNDLMM